jgi:hypothetical protein
MPDRKTKSYRNVSLSLYLSDLAEADRVAAALRRAGWPTANRSLVMRERLHLLQEALAGKSDEDLFQFFLARYRMRSTTPVGRSVPPPDVLPDPEQ